MDDPGLAPSTTARGRFLGGAAWTIGSLRNRAASALARVDRRQPGWARSSNVRAKPNRNRRQRTLRQRIAAGADRRAVRARKPRARAGNGRRAEGDRGAAGIGLVYKTSFDKANRTSATSARGIGLSAALPIFAEIRETLGNPGAHRRARARAVRARSREAVDVLQIPAFLCRQTDLLVAAARTGRVVNVKKGQFLAPWDMANVVAKIDRRGQPATCWSPSAASRSATTRWSPTCARCRSWRAPARR